MEKATSCGGVVIYRGKILVLYLNIKNRYEGWVLPKGTIEEGESHEQTALREVMEETSVKAKIVSYIGKTQYSFSTYEGLVEKSVHWFLMTTDSYDCKPQREENFSDVGFYKYHEAIHLLKFDSDKQMVEQAYSEYQRRRKNGIWENY